MMLLLARHLNKEYDRRTQDASCRQKPQGQLRGIILDGEEGVVSKGLEWVAEVGESTLSVGGKLPKTDNSSDD